MEEWSIEIEPLAGILRVFKHGGTYGDDYEWAAAIRYISPTEIEFVGATKPLLPSMWRDGCKQLKELGIKKIKFKRIKNGVETDHYVDLT